MLCLTSVGRYVNSGVWNAGGPPPSLPLLQLQVTKPIVSTLAGVEDFARFTQIPRLEYSDEGSVAITSLQDRVIDERVERVVNEWHTFGPIAGASHIANATLRYREYFGPALGIPVSAYPGESVCYCTSTSRDFAADRSRLLS